MRPSPQVYPTTERVLSRPCAVGRRIRRKRHFSIVTAVPQPVSKCASMESTGAGSSGRLSRTDTGDDGGGSEPRLKTPPDGGSELLSKTPPRLILPAMGRRPVDSNEMTVYARQIPPTVRKIRRQEAAKGVLSPVAPVPKGLVRPFQPTTPIPGVIPFARDGDESGAPALDRARLAPRRDTASRRPRQQSRAMREQTKMVEQSNQVAGETEIAFSTMTRVRKARTMMSI